MLNSSTVVLAAAADVKVAVVIVPLRLLIVTELPVAVPFDSPLDTKSAVVYGLAS